MKHKLTFANQSDERFNFMLEPWGEDYWISPGEEFTFVPEAPDDAFHFAIVYHADYVAIFAEGGCNSVRVECGGKRLECGHQRPPGAFE